MTYNWEKIFESMSSQELYKIYTGQTLKPKEAIPFAKKELDKRGFDFEDMDTNIKNWQLINALEDKEYDWVNYGFIFHIPLKLFPLFVIGFAIFFYLLGYYTEDSEYTWKELILPTSLATITILTHNLIYKYRKNQRKKRQQKIDRLRAELKHQGISKNNKLFQDKGVFKKDFDIQQEKISTLYQLQIIGLIVMTIILLLILVYRYKKVLF